MRSIFLKLIRFLTIIIGVWAIGFSLMYIISPASLGNNNYTGSILQRVFESIVLLVYGLQAIFPYRVCFKNNLNRKNDELLFTIRKNHRRFNKF